MPLSHHRDRVTNQEAPSDLVSKLLVFKPAQSQDWEAAIHYKMEAAWHKGALSMSRTGRHSLPQEQVAHTPISSFLSAPFSQSLSTFRFGFHHKELKISLFPSWIWDESASLFICLFVQLSRVHIPRIMSSYKEHI